MIYLPLMDYGQFRLLFHGWKYQLAVSLALDKTKTQFFHHINCFASVMEWELKTTWKIIITDLQLYLLAISCNKFKGAVSEPLVDGITEIEYNNKPDFAHQIIART